MSKENESLIHITLTNTLKAKLKEMKKTTSFSTISDFVREAIREKIRKIENPSLNQNNSNISSEYLQIIKRLDNVEKLNKLLLEKIKTIGKIENTTTSLKALTLNGLAKENIELKTEKIYNVLLEHGELNIKAIKDKTGFDRIVIDILNRNPKLFKLNINTGKWGAINNE